MSPTYESHQKLVGQPLVNAAIANRPVLTPCLAITLDSSYQPASAEPSRALANSFPPLPVEKTVAARQKGHCVPAGSHKKSLTSPHRSVGCSIPVLINSVLAHCSCVPYSGSLVRCLCTSSAGTSCSVAIYNKVSGARCCVPQPAGEDITCQGQPMSCVRRAQEAGLVGAHRRSHWACKHTCIRSCSRL